MNTDFTRIEIDGVYVDVIRKNIKNVHLWVHPPAGGVTVSAPLRMDMEIVRGFCIAKAGWIKRQQEKIRAKKYELPSEYLTGENHFYLGKKYLLKVIEGTARKVLLNEDTIFLYVRGGDGKKKRKELLEKWYKLRLKELVLPHIERFESIMNVKAAKVIIRSMKTRWGSCNFRERKICLNTELAKKPFESIEYVLIHELAHLLERGHQKGFKAVMDKFSPDWRRLRKELKSK